MIYSYRLEVEIIVEMSNGAKRISIFLNATDHAKVETRAAAASLSLPAYLRSIALGKVPESHLEDVVTARLANLATRLQRIAEQSDENESKRELLELVHKTQDLLKRHVAAASK